MQTAFKYAMFFFLVVSLTLSVYQIWVVHRGANPYVFESPLPQRAEVLPARQVQPGTFKVKLALGELLQRAQTSTETVLVSYGPGGRLIDGWGTAVRVEYWLPRGHGTFYYAVYEHQPPASWPSEFMVREVRREDRRLVAYPGYGGPSMAGKWGLGVLCGILGLICGWGWRKEVCKMRTPAS